MSVFTNKIKEGRSLIFVQSRKAHDRVLGALRVKLVPYFSTTTLGPHNALVRYMSYLPKNAALVAVVPGLVTGCIVRADRIIWIPGDSYLIDGPEYNQAMARVRSPKVKRLVINEDDV